MSQPDPDLIKARIFAALAAVLATAAALILLIATVWQEVS